jgi:tetratricopeptide (TPR) repeat protein
MMDTMASRTRTFLLLLWVPTLALVGPGAVRADDPTVHPHALPAASVAIDDADPERSVPDAEWAHAHPMEMGYLMMAFADRADAAEKARDYLAAARYYRALGKAVPDRAVSFGKACRAYEAAGDVGAAAASCREALGKGGVTVDDHLRFVRTTLRLPGSLDAHQVADVEAVLQRLDEDVDDGRVRQLALQLRCDLELRLEHAGRLERCLEALRSAGAPGAKLVAYEWSLAMLKGDAERASDLIERARQLGLPASAIASMRSRLERAGPDVRLSPRSMGIASMALGVMVLAGLAWRIRHRPRPTEGV